jgi:transposase
MSAPKPDEDVCVSALYEQGSHFKQAATLCQDFFQMVRDRRADLLDRWMARVAEPGIAVELQRFVNGLRSDLSGVRAAFSLPWSNGQTEGQVNRLKLIKRQMFGRAKFDLLRQRVLYGG